VIPLCLLIYPLMQLLSFRLWHCYISGHNTSQATTHAHSSFHQPCYTSLGGVFFPGTLSPAMPSKGEHQQCLCGRGGHVYMSQTHTPSNAVTPSDPWHSTQPSTPTFSTSTSAGRRTLPVLALMSQALTMITYNHSGVIHTVDRNSL
jgi:hypothetical protein